MAYLLHSPQHFNIMGLIEVLIVLYCNVQGHRKGRSKTTGLLMQLENVFYT